ncbi:MAG: hypothetical protein AAGB00_09265 [Planctomycetota bacterium]
MDRRSFALGLGALATTSVASTARGALLGDLSIGVINAALGDGARYVPNRPEPARVVEHWRAVENSTWRWLERAELADGVWRATGMTLPVHRGTGHPISGRDCADYVLACAAPSGLQAALLRPDLTSGPTDYCLVREGAAPGPMPMPQRKARHGRPPSRWARDLSPAELRAWLASFDPPRADVSGMTFAEHLTRDHGFAIEQVARLNDREQAKLHGAAHRGY